MWHQVGERNARRALQLRSCHAQHANPGRLRLPAAHPSGCSRAAKPLISSRHQLSAYQSPSSTQRRWSAGRPPNCCGSARACRGMGSGAAQRGQSRHHVRTSCLPSQPGPQPNPHTPRTMSKRFRGQPSSPSIASRSCPLCSSSAACRRMVLNSDSSGALRSEGEGATGGWSTVGLAVGGAPAAQHCHGSFLANSPAQLSLGQAGRHTWC